MTDWFPITIAQSAVGIATFAIFSYFQDLKFSWIYSNHFSQDKMSTNSQPNIYTTSYQSLVTETPDLKPQSTTSNTPNIFESLFFLFIQYKNILLLYGFLGGIMMTLFATTVIVIAIKLYQWFNTVRVIQTIVDPPAKYNNTVNINVWLKDCEKYFAAANIISDDNKKEETLKRLDPTSREVVQQAIKNKQLKRYEEIANEIKRLYGTNEEVARNYIRDFSTREQKSTETVLQFYMALEELANKAFALNDDRSKDVYIRDQFLQGLLNKSMAANLLGLDYTQISGKKLLIKAVEIENKLNTNNAIQTHRTLINNINTSDDTAVDNEIVCNNINTKVNFKDQRPTNRSPPPPQTEAKAPIQNKPTCNACLATGHLAYQCTNTEAYKNYCYERDRYISHTSNQLNQPNQSNHTSPYQRTYQGHQSFNSFNRNDRDRNRDRSQDHNRSNSRDNPHNRKRSFSNTRNTNSNPDGKPDTYPKDLNTNTQRTVNVTNLQASQTTASYQQ
jgi:hypothetical protein